VANYADLVRNNDFEMDQRFRRGMRDEGVFIIPFQLKRWHISASHTDEDIDKAINAAHDVLSHLK